MLTNKYIVEKIYIDAVISGIAISRNYILYATLDLGVCAQD